jgi:hypothetical protein
LPGGRKVTASPRSQPCPKIYLANIEQKAPSPTNPLEYLSFDYMDRRFSRQNQEVDQRQQLDQRAREVTIGLQPRDGTESLAESILSTLTGLRRAASSPGPSWRRIPQPHIRRLTPKAHSEQTSKSAHRSPFALHWSGLTHMSLPTIGRLSLLGLALRRQGFHELHIASDDGLRVIDQTSCQQGCVEQAIGQQDSHVRVLPTERADLLDQGTARIDL